MPEKKMVGCARPTGGPVGGPAAPEKKDPVTPAKEKKNMIMVGKKAPDFASPAYHAGKFTSLKLSDFLGKWVVLCCYPGDFTFV
jgi:peroxiredoxin (alkyl hydroperoxide reductase subunit C)